MRQFFISVCLPAVLAALVTSCASTGPARQKEESPSFLTTDGSIRVLESEGDGFRPGRPPKAVTADTVRRRHLRIKNEKKEKEFLNIIAGKNLSAGDIATVTRLLREKEIEFKQFNESLTKNYGIVPERRFHFDQRKSTIYELIPSPTSSVPQRVVKDQFGERKISIRRPVPVVHMVLDTKAKAATFVRLTASKKLTAQQIEALTMLLREKELELGRYEQLMMARFAISRDRQYQYESETRTLYELVPVPTAGSVE